MQAIALGVMCNALVCLAVWLAASARSTTDKILAMVFPITAFVAAGFEHSIANMYFIPMGLFIKADGSAFVLDSHRQDGGGFRDLTWANFFLANLAAGYHRQHHRRGRHGRPGVLVHLPAAASDKMTGLMGRSTPIEVSA